MSSIVLDYNKMYMNLNVTQNVNIGSNLSVSGNVLIQGNLDLSNCLLKLGKNSDSIAEVGTIRYNPIKKAFEGYSENLWNSLGGESVISGVGIADRDGNTKILTEANEGNNNEILFYTGNKKNLLDTDSHLRINLCGSKIYSNLNIYNGEDTLAHYLNIQVARNNHVLNYSENSNFKIQQKNIDKFVIENSNNIIINGKIGINTNNPNGNFHIYGNDGLIIPVGNNSQRGNNNLGKIRYNTDNEQFEGYGTGNTWGSLGGVTDVNQDTYINAHDAPGVDNDELKFFTGQKNNVKDNNGNVINTNEHLHPKMIINGNINMYYNTNIQSNLNILANTNINHNLNVFANTNITNDMHIFGKIGIGTNNPNAKLDVNGTIKAGIAGNSSANYPALLVTATGTNTEQAAIAIQQATTEGNTIIYADFEPHIEWGINTNNALNTIDFTGGTSTNNLDSKIFYNNSGNSRTAYIKSRFHLDSGNFVVGGNIGIGSTIPTHKLDVQGNLKVYNHNPIGNSHALLDFGDADNGANANRYGFIYHDATNMHISNVKSGELHLATTQTTRMLIDSNGNVGIGTDNPIKKLEVSGDCSFVHTSLTDDAVKIKSPYHQLKLQTDRSSNSYIKWSTSGSNGDDWEWRFAPTGDTSYRLWLLYLNEQYFYTNNEILCLKFNSNGNVGVGTDNPTTKFEVATSNSGGDMFRLTRSTNNQFLSMGHDSGAYLFGLDYEALRFGTNNTERMRITGDGNVGIGTTSPDSKFQIGNSTVNTLHRSETAIISDTSNSGTELIALNLINSTSAAVNNAVSLAFNVGNTWPAFGKITTICTNPGPPDSAYHSADMTFSLWKTGFGDLEEKMRITADGNVGIGTKNPKSILHITSNDETTLILEGGQQWETPNNPSTIDKVVSQIQFKSLDVSVNRIDYTGPSNSQDSSIQGVCGAIQSINEYNNGALVGMSFSTFQQASNQRSLTEKMRIKSDGNVGIGTENPQSKLHVNGDIELIDTKTGDFLYIYTPTEKTNIDFNGTINNPLSYLFDGINDYFEISTTNSPQLASSNFTIEFWCKINSFTGSWTSIYRQGSENDHDHLAVLIDSNYIYLNFSNGRADFDISSINIQNWNHFAILFDSLGFTNMGSALCYLNGNILNPTYWDNGDGLLGMKGQTSASGAVTIGKNIGFNTYFNGELKQLRVYNVIKYTSDFDLNTLTYSKQLETNLQIYVPMTIVEENSKIYTVNNKLYYNDGLVVKENKEGNVGIGTNKPETTLHVEGDIKLTGTLYQSTISPLVPINCVIMWWGSAATIPLGWVLCDGSNYTPDLRDRFIVGAGNNYSLDDTGGESTVTLTQNEMPSHTHPGTNSSTNIDHTHSGSTGTQSDNHTHGYNDIVFSERGGPINLSAVSNVGSGDTDNDNGGFEINRTTGNNNQNHTHSFTTGGMNSNTTHTHTISLDNTGGGAAHENKPPYYALFYIMYKGV